ncbi:MAG: hypothetical protein CTY16_01485 [Methylobacter sp.]|nr:MAG: hypothetical protein CTY16_01485 [Methylobacter sp.]
MWAQALNWADGISGPDTTQAVKNFQTKAKLAADGKVGPMTKAAIKQALANKGQGG